MEKMAKRKRCVISLEHKMKIISDIREGKAQKTVSETHGVPRSTVAEIWKSREKIENYVSSSESPILAKRKRIVRNSKFEHLEKACVEWLEEKRSRDEVVSGCSLREKALELFPSLYPEADKSAFVASSGWLYRFSQRHGIKSKPTQTPEPESSVISESELQALQSKSGLFGYSADQIFTADETSLLWRLMPSPSLAPCEDVETGACSLPRFRVTLLGSSNASGRCKLPLGFVHSDANPKCFGNVDIGSLPVWYMPQAKSWVDATVFEWWFHHRFVPHVKQFCIDQGIEYKVLLLIRNSPMYPSADRLTSQDGNVTTLFVRVRDDSIFHPLRPGVFKRVKCRYKRRLLTHVISQRDASSLQISDIIKCLTVKDAVYWCSQAWEDVGLVSLQLTQPGVLPSNHENEILSDERGPSIEEFRALFSALDDTQIWPDPKQWLNAEDANLQYQPSSSDEIVDVDSVDINLTSQQDLDHDIEDSESSPRPYEHSVSFSASDDFDMVQESVKEEAPHLDNPQRFSMSPLRKRTALQPSALFGCAKAERQLSSLEPMTNSSSGGKVSLQRMAQQMKQLHSEPPDSPPPPTGGARSEGGTGRRQDAVSNAEAFRSLQTVLKWLEGQPDTDPFHLLLVRTWRDDAALKSVQDTETTMSNRFY